MTLLGGVALVGIFVGAALIREGWRRGFGQPKRPYGFPIYLLGVVTVGASCATIVGIFK